MHDSVWNSGGCLCGRQNIWRSPGTFHYYQVGRLIHFNLCDFKIYFPILEIITNVTQMLICFALSLFWGNHFCHRIFQDFCHFHSRTKIGLKTHFNIKGWNCDYDYFSCNVLVKNIRFSRILTNLLKPT